MKVRSVPPTALTTARVVLRFVTQEEAPVAPLTSGEFSAAAGSTFLLVDGKRRTLLVGLGPRAKVTDALWTRAAATAVRVLQKAGIVQATVDATRAATPTGRIVEGAILGGYQFEPFLPAERRLKQRFHQLDLAVPPARRKADRAVIDTALALGNAANYARSLGDLPPNLLTPETLAHAAHDLARADRTLHVTVRDERKLRAEGFGGILAVGGGSANPPRLITIEYRGGRASEKPVVLVGKAITFDSGGISIKPADGMDEMKYDKMGGCAVLGIMQGLSALKIKRNVTALIAAAENLPSSEAYRPGDIVSTYDGQTVEVLNTDAEGRIVLADALGYARRHLEPACLIDYATLTGACVVALSGHYAGLFTNDRDLAAGLTAAGVATGDRVWELPHDEPFHDQIRSDVAAVKNTGGRWGGACTAAAFLEKWIDPATPWAHLDIAGTAWLQSDKPHLPKGATGFGVRLTLEWLRA